MRIPAFLLTLFCLLSVGTASAQVVPKVHGVSVVVQNNSDHCAWVTIYWGRIHTPWMIEQGAAGRPRSVGPHQTVHFGVPFTTVGPVPIPAEIKVRSEFWGSAACSGRTVADRGAENRSIMLNGITGMVELPAYLHGPPSSGYGVSLGKPIDTKTWP